MQKESTSMQVQQALDMAQAHIQAGRFLDAEATCNQILASNPAHPESLHMLGTLFHRVGQNEKALELINRSIALRPEAGGFYVNLGVVLESVGRVEEAIEAYSKAIILQPNLPITHFNLGNLLFHQKRFNDSAEAYKRALTLNPDYLEAAINLGGALYECGSSDEAAACYEHALALRADLPDVLSNLANIFFDKGQLDRALALVHRALQISPGLVDALNNLGRILLKLNRLDDALAQFKKAVEISPEKPDAYTNIANVLYQKGQLDEAVVSSLRAIAIDPESATAHWNLGICLLTGGDYSQGWKEYAWRSRVRGLKGVCKTFPQPRWDGRDLSGKTILLHAEQGLGDTLQFIRYAQLVRARRPSQIIFLCQPELISLLEGQTDIDRWIRPGESLPDFDLHCSLLDLPVVLETTVETIPAATPILTANSEKEHRWRQRMIGFDGLKVGLCWAGNPSQKNDPNRSMPLPALAKLAGVHRVCFFSLQKGKTAALAQTPPADLRLVDWTSEIHDFSDTAALIANLDLVISVDTVVAHLAGAMRRRAWTLLSFAADWRWLQHREDSPWYPTMRLFRQERAGDWSSPVARIKDQLGDFPF
jgi:tetratricopeptide (TPR) repeat protein